MILRFLKGNWAVLGLALALLGALTTLVVTNGKLSTARADIAALTAQKALLGQEIDQQNAGIDDLTKQREADRKAYLAGIQSANKRAVSLEVDAGTLLRLPSPATRDEQCAAAEALLLKELGA